MSSEYRQTKLQNGVRIATREMPHMHTACVGIWTGIGARHESAEEGGLSHFLEHMLFKGTKRRNAKQITEAVEGVGGYLNAFTTEDHTCYYAKAGSAHFERLADVLADLYCHSVFAPEEIERERDVITEEISMYRDQPAQHVQELLSETMWPEQPLGRPLTGTVETISKFKRPHLQKFWRENYHGGNTIITVAGRITHEQVVAAFQPRIGQLPAGTPRRPRSGRSRAHGPRIQLHTQDTGQTHVAMGFFTGGRRDQQRFALKLLSVILGENMSSRLFQQLRERHGFCYSVQSGLTVLSDIGLLSISAGVDTGKLQSALKVTLREIERLCNKPPGRNELQQAKEYTVGQTLMCLESTTNQMLWMGESLLGYRSVQNPCEIEQQLQRVTAEDIQRAASDCLHHGGLGVAVISPMKEVEKLVSWIGHGCSCGC